MEKRNADNNTDANEGEGKRRRPQHYYVFHSRQVFKAASGIAGAGEGLMLEREGTPVIGQSTLDVEGGGKRFQTMAEKIAVVADAALKRQMKRERKQKLEALKCFFPGSSLRGKDKLVWNCAGEVLKNYAGMMYNIKDFLRCSILGFLMVDVTRLHCVVRSTGVPQTVTGAEYLTCDSNALDIDWMEWDFEARIAGGDTKAMEADKFLARSIFLGRSSIFAVSLGGEDFAIVTAQQLKMWWKGPIGDMNTILLSNSSSIMSFMNTATAGFRNNVDFVPIVHPNETLDHRPLVIGGCVVRAKADIDLRNGPVELFAEYGVPYREMLTM